MINRNITRTILNATDTTEKTKTITSDSLVFEMVTSDFFYLGFTHPFCTRYFNFKTLNTNSTNVKVEYYTTSGWRSVEDLVDQTEGFTKSGFISWLNPGDWFWSEQAPIVHQSPYFLQGLLKYWVRISVSADLSAGTELQSVLNLFCDASDFAVLYPEMLSDSRYLPPGQTDFLPQFNAAKDLVVNRLKQSGKIREESQVLDINEVAYAAVHATAYLILFPIAEDDDTTKRRDDSFKAMNEQISRGVTVVDRDSSGDITDKELPDPVTYMGR